MFFELIGTVLAGLAAGLLVWAINRALGGRLPGWLVPVAAGAAMIAATISSEYGWYGRTKATMPQGFEVADAIKDRSMMRPWTYAVPYVSRFVAVDIAGQKTHPDHPGVRIVDLVFYGRWARTARVPMVIDCPGKRSADIVDGVEFGSGGEITGARWAALPEDDPLLMTVCKDS